MNLSPESITQTRYTECLLEKQSAWVGKLFGAASVRQHCPSGLALYFDEHDIISYDGFDGAYTHHWDIVYALWTNRTPVPELQTLTKDPSNHGLPRLYAT